MTQQSGGGAGELPDYLVPVAPRRQESPPESPDYLVPVDPRLHLERLAAIPDNRSDYLTPPPAAQHREEEDVPLYQAPLPITEQHEGGAEYERLHLYETIGL